MKYMYLKINMKTILWTIYSLQLINVTYSQGTLNLLVDLKNEIYD